MYSIHDVKDDSGKLLRSYILCTIFDFSGGQTASNAFGEDSEVSELENSFSTLYADQKIEEIALVGCDVDRGPRFLAHAERIPCWVATFVSATARLVA